MLPFGERTSRIAARVLPPDLISKDRAANTQRIRPQESLLRAAFFGGKRGGRASEGCRFSIVMVARRGVACRYGIRWP